MILTRAPLRVSFFGGGTDLPEYYEQFPGTVLSAAIDIHMHIAVNDSPHKRVKACYDELEVVNHCNELKHGRIREILNAFSIPNNIEVSSFCHIPTKGTGLGSSSSFTVALIKALVERQRYSFNNYDLANAAYHVERNLCGEMLGKQDQFAAAFGGTNLITFDEECTQVLPVPIGDSIKSDLENRLMFFYTGIKRTANDILQAQALRTSSDGSAVATLAKMAEQAHLGRDYLVSNKLDDFGALLDDAWHFKKTLCNDISNSQIDAWYDEALNAGALGGKLLGAGGGGFLMLYVPLNRQDLVRASLDLEEYKFKFCNTGAETLYVNRDLHR